MFNNKLKPVPRFDEVYKQECFVFPEDDGRAEHLAGLQAVARAAYEEAAKVAEELKITTEWCEGSPRTYRMALPVETAEAIRNLKESP